MTHQAIFQVEMKYASIVYHAIIPEQDDELHERSHGKCTLVNDTLLEISIQATDLSALRASLNTWLRLIQVSSEMIDRTQI
jgi:KEOPS complex subunit Pcc1